MRYHARVAPTKHQPGRAREDHNHPVIAWRREILEKAGYDAERAERIAQSDADLHVAVRMLEQGCTPELAEQILV